MRINLLSQAMKVIMAGTMYSTKTIGNTINKVHTLHKEHSHRILLKLKKVLNKTQKDIINEDAKLKQEFNDAKKQ